MNTTYYRTRKPIQSVSIKRIKDKQKDNAFNAVLFVVLVALTLLIINQLPDAIAIERAMYN